MTSSLTIGCSVGVVSSAMQSIGLTLQRKSHLMEQQQRLHRPVYRNSIWRLGLALFLLSNIFGSSVQISTLPLIVLSPLQAIGLVFNSICATIILKEPFTVASLFGTVLVSTGAVIIALFGVVVEPNHDLDELLYLLKQPRFLSWMISTLFLCAIAAFFALRSKELPGFSRRGQKQQLLARGVLFGVISGVLSAHSLLMAKSAVELLIHGLSNRWKDFLRYQTWIIVGLFLVFAISQLIFMNKGLHLCSTSVLYPLVFCVYNVTVIFNGLIYYKQASRLAAYQFFFVIFGTLLVLVGVLSLSADALSPEPVIDKSQCQCQSNEADEAHESHETHASCRRKLATVHVQEQTGTETTPLLGLERREGSRGQGHGRSRRTMSSEQNDIYQELTK